MSFGEALRAAWEGVSVNRFRTFLAMLGVVIGVAAVVAVVAIGEGGRHAIASTLEAADAQAIQIVPEEWEDLGNPQGIFHQRQVDQVSRLAGVRAVITSTFASLPARAGRHQTNLSVTGTTFAYPLSDPLQLVAGRFWSAADDRAARRLVVLDEIAVEALFPGLTAREAVGQVARLDGIPYRVMGVVRSRAPSFGGFAALPERGRQGSAYVPLSTWRTLTGMEPALAVFAVVPEQPQEREAVAARVIRVLERSAGGSVRYRTFDLSQLAGAIGRVTGILTLVVGSIAGIALFVGSIGVMNIMLVSVAERTAEIGLRMALGATRGQVLLQFLLECMMITGTGGALGIALGTGTAWAIAALAGWPPLVSVLTVVVAVVVSLLVGVVAGLYPARRAARLDPMEALRYE